MGSCRLSKFDSSRLVSGQQSTRVYKKNDLQQPDLVHWHASETCMCIQARVPHVRAHPCTMQRCARRTHASVAAWSSPVSRSSPWLQHRSFPAIRDKREGGEGIKTLLLQHFHRP